jgi:hypothetical protein
MAPLKLRAFKGNIEWKHGQVSNGKSLIDIQLVVHHAKILLKKT